MPRDSQILPPTSRALLRAARAGCIHIRQGIRAADDEEKSVVDAEESAATSNMADRSFTTRKWMTLPKHLEPAEVEFLAKRRPGLPSLYGATAGTDGSSSTSGPMRRTKFKKVDPDTGNISIYEAWVPEGHRIEGEITGDVQTIVEQSEVPVKPEAPAPGTVVEGVGVVNAEGVVVAEAGSAAVMTPPKRRPPPPKRKGRGIGKGRKKKVMFAPGEGADAATVHGVGSGSGNNEAGFKEHGQQDASRMSIDQMSIDQSGQDEDDEDGEEGDESDEGDESMMDVKTPETPQPPSGAEFVGQPSLETSAGQSVDVDHEMTDAVPEIQPSAPELSLSTGEDMPSQQQEPTEKETPQLKESPGKDTNALVSMAPTGKPEVRDLDEKPILPQTDETDTSLSTKDAISDDPAEIAAEVGEVQGSRYEPQGEGDASKSTPELVPKEEPGLTIQQDTAVVPPFESPKLPSEAPDAQDLGQPHTLGQESQGVAEPEPIPASIPAIPEPPIPGILSNESIVQSDTPQEPPAPVQDDQPSPSYIPGADVNSDEAKSVEPKDANTVPDTKPIADSDSLPASSAAVNSPHIEPSTITEQSVVSSSTATGPTLAEEPTPALDGNTDATTEANVTTQLPVGAELEQQEVHLPEDSQARLDQLPDPTPEPGPANST
jgi:hypothetical protein